MTPVSHLIHRRAWQLILLLAVVNFAVACADIYIYAAPDYFPPTSVAEHLAALDLDLIQIDECQSPDP